MSGAGRKARTACTWLRFDLRIADHGSAFEGEGEERPEGRVAGPASIESGDELIETGVQMRAPQPATDASRPFLQAGTGLVDPEEEELSGVAPTTCAARRPKERWRSRTGIRP